MMMDEDIVAVSPSSVYRVLREAGAMRRPCGGGGSNCTIPPPGNDGAKCTIDIFPHCFLKADQSVDEILLDLRPFAYVVDRPHWGRGPDVLGLTAWFVVPF